MLCNAAVTVYGGLFTLESTALYRTIYIRSAYKSTFERLGCPVLQQVPCGQRESMNSLRNLHCGPSSSKFILFEDLMLATPPLGCLQGS